MEAFVDEYARFAGIYDTAVGPFLRPIHQAMLTTLSSSKSHMIIDLCCGTGLMAGRAADAGMKVVGVDISPAMLSVARAKYPAVNFIEGDATSLTFSDGEFDAATISFALHEKPADIAMDILKEAMRVVKTGGLILVADYRQPTPIRARWTGWVINAVERLAGKEHSAHYKRYMKAGGTESFLNRAGLEGTSTTTFMSGWGGLYVR